MTIKVYVNDNENIIIDNFEYNNSLNSYCKINCYIKNDYLQDIKLYDNISIYKNDKLLFYGIITSIKPNINNNYYIIEALDYAYFNFITKVFSGSYPKYKINQIENYKIIYDSANNDYYICFNDKIEPNTSKTYTIKIGGLVPQDFDLTIIDGSVNQTTITSFTKLDDYTIQITVNNTSTTDTVEQIKVLATGFLSSTNINLLILDSVHEQFFNYMIKNYAIKNGLIFNISTYKNYKKYYVIQQSSGSTEIDYYSLFNKLDYTINYGNIDVTNGLTTLDDNEFDISINVDNLNKKQFLFTFNIATGKFYIIDKYDDYNYNVIAQIDFDNNDIKTYKVINGEIIDVNYYDIDFSQYTNVDLKITIDETIKIYINDVLIFDISYNIYNNLHLCGINNSLNSMYMYYSIYSDKIYYELKQIDDNTYLLKVINNDDINITNYPLLIKEINFASYLIYDYPFVILTDIIVDFCNLYKIKYQIDDIDTELKSYSFGYRYGYDLLNDIISLVDAYYKFKNGKLYILTTPKNIINITDNDIVFVDYKHDYNNFANKVITISNDIEGKQIISTAVDYDSISKYGEIVKIIQKTDLNTTELLNLYTYATLNKYKQNISKIKLKILNDNIEVGDLIFVDSNKLKIKEEFLATNIKLTYKNDILIDCEIDGNFYNTDINKILNMINEKINNLYNSSIKSQPVSESTLQTNINLSMYSDKIISDIYLEFDVNIIKYAKYG